MTQNLKTVSITSLRWTLGLVVLLESIHFTISPFVASHFATMGFPLWSRYALGGSEILGAILLLMPFATSAGGYLPANSLRRRDWAALVHGRVRRGESDDLRGGNVRVHFASGHSKNREHPLTDQKLMLRFENATLHTDAFHHAGHGKMDLCFCAGTGRPKPFVDSRPL